MGRLYHGLQPKGKRAITRVMPDQPSARIPARQQTGRKRRYQHPQTALAAAWNRGTKRPMPRNAAQVFRRRALRLITQQTGQQPILNDHPVGKSLVPGFQLSWAGPDGQPLTAWVRVGRLVRHNIRLPRWHIEYRWNFRITERPHRGPEPRAHPTFWLLCCSLYPPFQPGGVIVIPDCVLPEHWRYLRLAQAPYWVWKFFQ